MPLIVKAIGVIGNFYWFSCTKKIPQKQLKVEILRAAQRALRLSTRLFRKGPNKQWGHGGHRVGRNSLCWPFQCVFDILNAMIAGVTVKIKGPFRSALPATEPFFRCILKRSQYILLNLPVPS